MVVLAAVGQQPKRRGREKAQVGASGVDRVTRKLFEAHRKTPPEKFSGGGEVVPCGGNMEMEPGIENMTISEYLEYEAAKDRRLLDDVRSRRSPTYYNEADVNSFHRNMSKTFSYPYFHNLTPPHPCFLPVQPHPKNYFVSTNESNDVDIENMTIAEYNLYVAKQGLGMNPLNNHSYGFTPQFFAQPPHKPNTGKKDSDFDKILDELFRTEAENIKRMGHDIVQDSIWEQDDDSEEDQEEDSDDGDTFDMWDITVEDVERIRKFFNVPDDTDEVVQPLIPEPIHTTPPNDDYVAPATKLILDKLLEELKDKILNVTMVDDEADFNPIKDLEELERLLAKEPQLNFMEIQGYYSEETNFEGTSTRNYVVMLLLLQQLRRNQHINELCGYVLWKPSRDFTRPLGPPNGLKGLLHTLNATMILTKPYRLCTYGGAWILNKLRGSITNWTSWMLYMWLVKFPVMMNVARRRRPGALL
ncbi:hypothetical protein Tco_1385553 [Tanacetum coccineum]